MKPLTPEQLNLVEQLMILNRDQVSIWTIKQEMEVKLRIQREINEIWERLKVGSEPNNIIPFKPLR